MPAANEKPAPAACGTHHIFRTHGRRFVIILCPTKSITAGFTCVATYNVPEWANGRNSGFDSVPYPPEIARRVEYASNPAVLCPAADNPIHANFCFGAS